MAIRALLACLLLVPQHAASGQTDVLLRRLIEGGRHPAIRWSRFGDVQAEARRLYAGNGWVPLWLNGDRATGSARALLDALATAGDRGLAAADYDAVQLGALAATLARGGGDAEQAARFDAALTIAGLRFVRALARGRAPPTLRGESFDGAAALTALRGNPDPAALLAGLEPPWAYYHALRRALARYRALERDTALLRLPRPGPRPLGAGAGYRGAALLRRLLAAYGDLSGSATAPRPGDSLLTPDLVEGLYRFQSRVGARVDGVLSEATWRLLIGLGPRIRQMALALERWRWLPRDSAGNPLLVSLPAGRARYLGPAAAGHELSVSLGAVAPASLLAEPLAVREWLTTVIFHPRDLAAKLSLQGAGSDGLRLYGSSPFDLDSRPGAGKARNAIWIADAQLLAELLLHDQPEWTAGRVHSALAAPQTRSVPLRQPVQLLVVYGTAVARENGQVFFYPDAAGHDRRLEQQLAGVYR